MKLVFLMTCSGMHPSAHVQQMTGVGGGDCGTMTYRRFWQISCREDEELQR